MTVETEGVSAHALLTLKNTYILNHCRAIGFGLVYTLDWNTTRLVRSQESMCGRESSDAALTIEWAPVEYPDGAGPGDWDDRHQPPPVRFLTHVRNITKGVA